MLCFDVSTIKWNERDLYDTRRGRRAERRSESARAAAAKARAARKHTHSKALVVVRVTVSSVAPTHRALIDEERASGGRAHPSIRSWTQDKGLARAREHERESKVVRNGRPKLTHGFMLSPKSSEIIRAIRRRLTAAIRPLPIGR